MSVHAILRLKGSKVVTGDPNMTLAEVCARLAQNKIGAIVMTDEAGRVVGIISERDIVRELALGGAAVLDDAAGHHMTRKVVTCTRHDTLDDVMETMTRERFRHVPVVEENQLIGIVSIGDVVKQRMNVIEREAEEIRSYIATA